MIYCTIVDKLLSENSSEKARATAKKAQEEYGTENGNPFLFPYLFSIHHNKFFYYALGNVNGRCNKKINNFSFFILYSGR